MRNSDKLLNKAKVLLQNKKYSSVIRLLEPRIPRYLENPDFMLYLGAACYYIGDIGGALSYLGRGERIDSENMPVLLYIAVSQLKKNNTTEAVRLWLAILDHEPNNTTAKRGLAAIRKFRNPEEHRRFCQSKAINSLVPGFGISFSNIVFIFLILVFSGIIISFGFLLLNQKDLFKPKNNSRSSDLGITRIISNRESIIEPTYSAKYILTEKEVTASFRKAVNSFNEGDDNAAHLEINRIKLSNASSAVKGKVHLLEGHLITPGFDDFRTNFTYQDVMTDPELYKGCYILWKGRISNLVENTDSIAFNFLAGYDSGQVLDGIVTVKFDNYVSINTSLPVELIAQIVINDGKMELKGSAIHTIIP